MGNLKISFGILFAFCAVIAFVDIDFDAESEASARASMHKQTMYMNQAQIRAYIADLDVIDAAGRMGGARGRALHGMEAHDIHDLANDIRVQSGRTAQDFPSKSVAEGVTKFFTVPFSLLWK